LLLYVLLLASHHLLDFGQRWTWDAEWHTNIRHVTMIPDLYASRVHTQPI